MIKYQVGKISKKIANRFEIMYEDEIYVARPRGKIKLYDNLYVGDNVLFSLEDAFANIEEILPRKNSLIRPNVANIDKAIIVVAKEPNPDFGLVDKMIINCYANDIEPVLCYNKSDLLSEQEIKKIISPYEKFMRCIIISAYKEKNLEALTDIVSQGVTCLAGQSAVGKTTILNSILDLNLRTAGLSKKISRGKHTTRHVEIFRVLDGMVMDTAGFSMLTLIDKNPNELKNYYYEFLKFQTKCRFTSCLHIHEPGCAVIEQVQNGTIDAGRYERYLQIYKDVKTTYDETF